jgi:hypothetical protein
MNLFEMNFQVELQGKKFFADAALVWFQAFVN